MTHSLYAIIINTIITIAQEQRKREGKEWTQEEEDALKKPIIARSGFLNWQSK